MPGLEPLPTRCGQRCVRLLELTVCYPFWAGVGWEGGYLVGQALGVTMNADFLPCLLVAIGDFLGFLVGVAVLAAFQIYITGVESAPPSPAGTVVGDKPMPRDRTLWAQLRMKLCQGDYPSGPLAVSFALSGAAWQFGAYTLRDAPLLTNCVLTASLTWLVICASYLVFRYFGLFSDAAAPVGRTLILEYLLGRYMAEFFFVFTCTSYYGESNFLLQVFNTEQGTFLTLFNAGLSKFVGFFLAELLFILPSELYSVPRQPSAEGAAASAEEREPLSAEERPSADKLL